ncbi:hypothetical protein L3X38_035374 [Prunus dulcis]|uniref:Uncharacterized protein n=1 Tax=Prunus dulcis TaxID=3755 RepID=A0AAD4VJK7_PRUDU|nr:hypothetical protein L3X38_035374 [Prunus dulcis]
MSTRRITYATCDHTKPLCDLLIWQDPRIITVCLEGPENILKVDEADKEMGMNDGINLYAQLVDECEGLDKIENLQTHDNSEIYEKAVKILERDWAEEEVSCKVCLFFVQVFGLSE